MIRIVFLGLIVIAVLVFSGNVVIQRSSSKDTQVRSATTQKEIAASELARHNTVSDCWTVIGGVVYDATTLLTTFSDIKAKLADYCGRDGTNIYTVQKYVLQQLDSKVTEKINEEIKKYSIGILVP